MRLTKEKLLELLELAKAATPTPWFITAHDDQYHSSMVCISTKAQAADQSCLPDAASTIAATLVQNPQYVNVADEKWDENARYIVAAVTVLPALIQEILESRRNDADDSV